MNGSKVVGCCIRTAVARSEQMSEAATLEADAGSRKDSEAKRPHSNCCCMSTVE